MLCGFWTLVPRIPLCRSRFIIPRLLVSSSVCVQLILCHLLSLIVAQVEDEGILGLNFLSKFDSRLDIEKKNQVSINGVVLTCSDFKNQEGQWL